MAAPYPVKRTACDRCNGQKMRCIRDSASESSKCNRCIAANAECNFSLARKAGRPPSNKQASTTTTQSTQSKEKTQRWQQTQDLLSSLSTPLATAESSCSTNHSSPEVLSLFDAPMLDDSSASSLFSSSSLSDTEFPDLEFPWGGMDTGSDTEALWLDTYTQLAVGDQFSQDPPLSTGFMDSLSTLPTNELSPAYNEHIGKLAALSGTLFTQTNLHNNDTSPMDNIEKLTAHVISSSSSLLDILESLRDSLARHDTTKAAQKSPYLLDTPSSTLDTATTLQILTAYIRLTQLHYTLYTRIQALLVSRPETPFVTSPSPPSSSASDCPTPPAFPSLAIGGISLAPYSRFQLKFLLQICVHHLGLIEVLLGLPVGFRVSDVDDGAKECSGLLAGRNGGTSFLVRAIMMGGGTPVKGIAETLEQLKKALEGRIQV